MRERCDAKMHHRVVRASNGKLKEKISLWRNLLKHRSDNLDQFRRNQRLWSFICSRQQQSYCWLASPTTLRNLTLLYIGVWNVVRNTSGTFQSGALHNSVCTCLLCVYYAYMHVRRCVFPPSLLFVRQQKNSHEEIFPVDFHFWLDVIEDKAGTNILLLLMNVRVKQFNWLFIQTRSHTHTHTHTLTISPGECFCGNSPTKNKTVKIKSEKNFSFCVKWWCKTIALLTHTHTCLNFSAVMRLNMSVGQSEKGREREKGETHWAMLFAWRWNFHKINSHFPFLSLSLKRFSSFHKLTSLKHTKKTTVYSV